MADAADLKRRYRRNVYLWPSNCRGRFPIDGIWDHLPPIEDALVYCCGPEAWVDAVANSPLARGRTKQLVIERFVQPAAGA